MSRRRQAGGRAAVRGWIRKAAHCAGCIGLLGWTAAAGGAPRQPPRAFDLAVAQIDVRQLSSTPMFRQVEVRCIVKNQGPKHSAGSASIVISRTTDEGAKVLKKTMLGDSLAPGAEFVVRSEAAAWFATPVPYRCEILYGESGGDADPS